MISSVKVVPLKFCKTKFFQICYQLDNQGGGARSRRKFFSAQYRRRCVGGDGGQADYIFEKIDFCKTWGAQLWRMISFLWWPILFLRGEPKMISKILQYKQEGRSFFCRRLFIWISLLFCNFNVYFACPNSNSLSPNSKSKLKTKKKIQKIVGVAGRGHAWPKLKFSKSKLKVLTKKKIIEYFFWGGDEAAYQISLSYDQ